MLSSLLQNLRVPHVVASSQAVPGKLDIELKGVMVFDVLFFLEDELEADILRSLIKKNSHTHTHTKKDAF